MLESTVYERARPRTPVPLTVDETTEEIKNMCTGCIMSALKDVTSDPFEFNRDRDPFSVVLSECVMVCGKWPNEKKHREEDQLKELFLSTDGPEFFELVEAAHHTIVHSYHHMSISDNLNIIFRRTNIGIRVKNGRFIFLKEETEFTEFIEPCLTILHEWGFDRANDHLCEAFDRCHAGDFNRAVSESSLALESVINQILDEEHIPQPEKKNDIMGRFKLLKQNGIAIFLDDSTGQFLQSVYSPIRARSNMPDVAHSGTSENIDEDEALYILGSAVSSILYIVRSYLRE